MVVDRRLAGYRCRCWRGGEESAIAGTGAE